MGASVQPQANLISVTGIQMLTLGLTPKEQKRALSFTHFYFGASIWLVENSKAHSIHIAKSIHIGNVQRKWGAEGELGSPTNHQDRVRPGVSSQPPSGQVSCLALPGSSPLTCPFCLLASCWTVLHVPGLTPSKSQHWCARVGRAGVSV